MEKRVYSIPVTWEVYGVMKVEASSYEEAKELVYGLTTMEKKKKYG